MPSDNDRNTPDDEDSFTVENIVIEPGESSADRPAGMIDVTVQIKDSRVLPTLPKGRYALDMDGTIRGAEEVRFPRWNAGTTELTMRTSFGMFFEWQPGDPLDVIFYGYDRGISETVDRRIDITDRAEQAWAEASGRDLEARVARLESEVFGEE